MCNINLKKIPHQFEIKYSMCQNLKYMLQKKTTQKIFKITLTLTNLTEITYVIEPKIIQKIITATKYNYKNYTELKQSK